MKSADERITEALRQPLETPDMTDSVMARLPVQRRSRLRWVYAAAIPILILAVFLFLSRGQKPEYQARKQPAPMSQSPIVRSLPPPATPPKTIVAQKPQPKGSAVRRHRHASKPPKPSPPSNALPSYHLSAVDQGIAQATLEQIRPDTPSLPPNEDAATIERPALGVIANCGPEQIPIEKLGG